MAFVKVSLSEVNSFIIFILFVVYDSSYNPAYVSVLHCIVSEFHLYD